MPASIVFEANGQELIAEVGEPIYEPTSTDAMRRTVDGVSYELAVLFGGSGGYVAHPILSKPPWPSPDADDLDETIIAASVKLAAAEPPAILTEGEALMLRTSMVALKELADRLNSAAYKEPSTASARTFGRLVGLLEVAADLSFDVLNCASSHGHCSVSERAIAQHLGR